MKSVRAPLKHIPMLAVGGVNAGNIPEFLKLCKGVGIGSALYKPGKSLAEIKETAIAMVQAACK